jgi:hypothetical protein
MNCKYGCGKMIPGGNFHSGSFLFCEQCGYTVPVFNKEKVK